MNSVNRWFNALDARERFLVVAGGLLLLVLLLYALVWRPIGERVERLRVTVAEQTALAQWMASAAAEVARLRASGAGVRGERQSLLSLTDGSARQAGLGGAIRRIEPEGSDRVRIVLEQAGFDTLVTWLERLASRHGVIIETVTVERRNEPGAVNASLVLRNPGA